METNQNKGKYIKQEYKDNQVPQELNQNSKKT